MFKFKVNGFLSSKNNKRVTRTFKTKYFMSESRMIDFGFKQGFTYITSVDYYSEIYRCWLHQKNR